MGGHNRSQKFLRQKEKTGGFKDVWKCKWHWKLSVYQHSNDENTLG